MDPSLKSRTSQGFLAQAVNFHLSLWSVIVYQTLTLLYEWIDRYTVSISGLVNKSIQLSMGDIW